MTVKEAFDTWFKIAGEIGHEICHGPDKETPPNYRALVVVFKNRAEQARERLDQFACALWTDASHLAQTAA